MKLEQGEQVIVAWAEFVHGPGWSNTPVWVLVEGTDGKLRREVVQPHEQSEEMIALFYVSSAAATSMHDAVNNLLAGGKERRKRIVGS